LKLTGVEVAAFNTTQGRRNRFQLNFRNHRKIIVVDGHSAWIGGHNVGDEYLGLDRRIGHWRDTHIRLRGPALLGVELAFATDWRWATRTALPVVQPDVQPGLYGHDNVLVFPSDPASMLEQAGLLFLQVIVAARQRIWIASPYFVPDEQIVSALELARLRGVDVRILLPQRPDQLLVHLASFGYYPIAERTGMAIYRYGPGFLHQKVLLVDDDIASVGTANLDNRSFRLNFELSIVVWDRGFAAAVAAMLEEDFAQSQRVAAGELDDRSFWFRFGVSLSRLLAPVL
jgi:cardiolipin synthase